MNFRTFHFGNVSSKTERWVFMANIVYGDDASCGIKKRVLHASRRELPEYPDGTRVTNAHFLFKNLDFFVNYISSFT